MTRNVNGNKNLPVLPYDEWVETRQVLHLLSQIIGKVRMEHHPKLNHWWHVPLYVGVGGLTTRAIPHSKGPFEIRLDVDEHHVVIEDPSGKHEVCPMRGDTSIASAYRKLMEKLEELGYPTSIHPVPFDCFTETPFPKCNEFDAYDVEYVERYVQVLQWLNREMTAFRGGFLGKSTPVHLFWHSFDLAVTFFSGETAPEMPDADPVTKEAYSHEVISFGFWPGDEEVQMPAFYSYTHPLPSTLTEKVIAPDEASWVEEDGGVTGFLPYDTIRQSKNPSDSLKKFLTSSFEAGVASADWPDLTTPWY